MKHGLTFNDNSCKNPQVGCKKILAALFVAVCTVVSYYPADLASGAQNLTAIDDHGSAWIVGTDVNGYSCWNLQFSGPLVLLQVQIGNSWVTKSKSVPKKNPSLCSDSSFPYAAIYHWKVDILGSPGNGSDRSRVILARERISPTKRVRGFISSTFSKQIYLSQDDLVSDYSDALGRILANASSGGSSNGSSKLSGCYFKGKFLHGNVYITNDSYSADLKVFVTSSSYSADLNVYRANSSYSASSCGQWYFTNNSFSADFTVYFAADTYSSDFSIFFTPNSYSAGFGL